MTTTFIAASGQGITRAEWTPGSSARVEKLLTDSSVTYVLNDPVEANTVYAATRDRGVLKSVDRGCTWTSIGLADQVVKSLAVCRADPNVIYAGTKPPALFVTHDGGKTWSERESFRALRRSFWFTPAEPGDPYVMGLAVSPVDPNRVVAGVELGGTFLTEDGGLTWSRHKWGTSRDCHSLRWHHTSGDHVYQAGGGWPAAISSDGGRRWKQPLRGLGWSIYGMACAADPADPSLWYASAAPLMILPEMKKMPRGHVEGEANAFIFRKRGSGRWERLGGGLPNPLPHMAYALVTMPGSPGVLYAGLSNGDVWHSSDYGDHWEHLPFTLERIQFSMAVL